MVFVVVTRPLQRVGGMAGNQRAPKAQQLPKVWARVVEGTVVAKERAIQRIGSKQ